MSSRLALVCAPLALSLTLAAAPRIADADCRSQWQKLSDVFRKLSPYVVKEVCTKLADGDAATAQTCVDDYEKKKAEVEKVIGDYNQDAGTEHIGPRGLGWEAWYTGKLLAERLFVGDQVLSDTASLSFTATGGTGAAPYDVTVCWIDTTTGLQTKEPITHHFTTNAGTWTQAFTGVATMRPLVYLKNSKISTKGHEYKLKMGIGGDPAYITRARTVASQSSQGKSTTPPATVSPVRPPAKPITPVRPPAKPQ